MEMALKQYGIDTFMGGVIKYKKGNVLQLAIRTLTYRCLVVHNDIDKNVGI